MKSSMTCKYNPCDKSRDLFLYYCYYYYNYYYHNYYYYFLIVDDQGAEWLAHVRHHIRKISVFIQNEIASKLLAISHKSKHFFQFIKH